MRVRRVRRPRRRQAQMRAALVVILALAILAALFIGIAACGAETKEAPQAEPQGAQESASATSRPTSRPEQTDATEGEDGAQARPWQPDEADVEYIAKTLYGEALIVKSTMRRAAVVWCILNRVDSGIYPDTIEGVVTAEYQFLGYSASHPVTDELRAITVDVLQRWHLEHEGEADVGRVLPKEYCFFVGDGWENYFTAEWRSTDYWDWSLPNPYED